MPDASTRRAALDAERDVGSRRVVSIQMFFRRRREASTLARHCAPSTPPLVRQRLALACVFFAAVVNGVADILGCQAAARIAEAAVAVVGLVGRDTLVRAGGWRAACADVSVQRLRGRAARRAGAGARRTGESRK
jgi:hypothetical protein